VVFACERIIARTLFFYWVIARSSIILRACAKAVGVLICGSWPGRPESLHRWVSG
jgi:hypothetical protein